MPPSQLVSAAEFGVQQRLVVVVVDGQARKEERIGGGSCAGHGGADAAGISGFNEQDREALL